MSNTIMSTELLFSVPCHCIYLEVARADAILSCGEVPVPLLKSSVCVLPLAHVSRSHLRMHSQCDHNWGVTLRCLCTSWLEGSLVAQA